MKAELTPDAVLWVEAELTAGHFATAEDAVRFAINSAKTRTLRDELEATEREGGSFTTEEVRHFVLHSLRELWDKGIASGDAGPVDMNDLRRVARARLDAAKDTKSNVT